MDSGQLNNATYPSHGNDNNRFGDFLPGIQNYATHDTTNDTSMLNFDPALFEGQDNSNHGIQSQPQRPEAQPRQQSFSNTSINQQNSGRTQSPALPAFTQSQQYAQHTQFPQSLYGQHNFVSQHSYDPQFNYARSSQSPAPFNQYSYGNHFGGQNYAEPMITQQRPSQSPAQQYSTTQQNYAQYASFLPQRHDPDMAQFANSRTPSQTTSQQFIAPSMLDGNHGGRYAQIPQHQLQPSQSGLYYPRPGSAIGQYQPPQPQTMQQGGQRPIQQSFVPQPTMQTQSMQAMRPNMEPVSNLPMKKARGRPRKDAAESSSDDDLEIEDEEPEPPPALIAVNPLPNPRAKAIHEAVRAVWCPRNKNAPTPKIKSGIADFGVVIRGLRDQWKDKNDQLKKAEVDKSPTAADAPRLREETAQFRSTVEQLCDKTVAFGHPAILKSLGEIPFTLSALYSFMLDRVGAVDYESSLLLAILKLADKFATIDEEKLESSKWGKLLQRVSKKAPAEPKGLAEKIQAHAAKQTARAAAAKAEVKSSGDLAAGVKRAREGESNGPPKKIVRPSSKPLAVQNAEKRAAEAAKKAKTATPAATTGGTLLSAAAKPKPPIKATPSISLGSIMSASKKPGTSNAERAALAKTKDTAAPAVQMMKREPVKRDSPPASVSVLAASAKTSSFLSSLLSVEKKEEVKVNEEEQIFGETPEQKSKRLHKESRRKLRVSWKNDSDLEEIRYFTHDPDEEIKQGDSAKKFFGDTGKEGEMLKRHKGMEDIEDEDEEGDDPDFDPDAYTSPTEVDLAGISTAEYDASENGIKHGGAKAPESKAKDDQAKFEEGSLMVFYSEFERPDSPKEPPEEGDDDFAPSDDFGEPDIKVRTREKDIYARRQVQGTRLDGGADQTYRSAQANTTDILSRLSQQYGGFAQPAPQQPQPPAPAQFDLQSIIATLQKQNSQATPAIQPAFQQPDPGAATAFLQALVAQSQQPQPAATQSSLLSNLGFGAPPPSDDYASHAGNGNGRGKKNGKPKKKSQVPLDEFGVPLNYKTVTCEWWKEGKCAKGDACTFKHSL